MGYESIEVTPVTPRIGANVAGVTLAKPLSNRQVEELHQALAEHQVEIVMAGDTHYFEHYLEKYESPGGTRTMQHFVNGGGGAYMSIGTPLDWPRQPAIPDCAFFPRTDAVIAKARADGAAAAGHK